MSRAVNPKGYQLDNEADLERLPTWARYQVRALQRELRDAQEILGEGSASSDTFAVGRWAAGRVTRPLGAGTRIRFSDFYEARFTDVGSGARALIVTTDAPMAIRPATSNRVIITRA